MKNRIISLITAATMILLTFSSCTLDSGISAWQTKVPDVVKKDYEKAVSLLSEKKLHGLISDKVESENQKDSVVSQDPEDGEKVNKGSIVRLVLSAGEKNDGDITVPDLSYYDEGEAKEVLDDLGLKTKSVPADKEENPNTAQGAVCWSTPDPGETLNEGDTVTLRVREDEPENIDKNHEVTVPDMTGKDFYDMIYELEDDNIFIYITDTEYGDESQKNKILSQETAAGTQVPEGTTIGVTVSKPGGDKTVPDVTYVKADSAQEMIEDSGLKANITYAESDRVAKGTVIEQKTDKGEKAQDGEEIDIIVSSGYTVEVPDVTGKNELEAITELFDAGLSVTAVTKADDTVEKGSIISQDVAAGEKVQLGTLVTIVVSGDKDDKKAADSDSGSSAEKVNYLTPNETDFENLGMLLTRIGAERGHEATDARQKMDYDYRSSEAYEYACEAIFTETRSGIFDYMDGMNGWNKRYIAEYDSHDSNYNKQAADPLNKFNNAEAVSVFDGNKVDDVFKNFFNVTPNHKDYYETFSYNGVKERTLRAYYYENKYYIDRFFEGGNPSGNIFVKDYTLKDDGTYEILASGYMLGSNEFIRNYMVTAGLKDIDGDRMWSIFKIEATNKTSLKTTPTVTASQKADTETILETYYKNNYNSSNSGRYITDFDQNGKKEMLVAESIKSNGTDVSDFNLYLITENNGAAVLSSTFKINNGAFKDYGVFDSLGGGETTRKQRADVYVNGSGYISCNTYQDFNRSYEHYFILKISGNKITEEKHLLDPGYTSGTGLYYYDGYVDNHEEAELFNDEMGVVYSAKYSSYSDALNGTLGGYGFKYVESHRVDDKFIIDPAGGYTEVYKYDTF